MSPAREAPLLEGVDYVQGSHHRRRRRRSGRRAQVRAGQRHVHVDHAGEPHEVEVRPDRGRGQRAARRRYPDGGARRGRPEEHHRAHRAVQARAHHQCGAALPGPGHHGRLPGDRRALPRHGQLRAARRGEVRVQLAVGLQGALREGGADGHPRVRLRPRPDQYLLRVGPEAPLRRDPHRRHHGLQCGQPWQAVRHELQPRDQHPRDHPARALLGERRVERDGAAEPVHAVRLRRVWGEGHVPPLSRGASRVSSRTSRD